MTATADGCPFERADRAVSAGIRLSVGVGVGNLVLMWMCFYSGAAAGPEWIVIGPAAFATHVFGFWEILSFLRGMSAAAKAEAVRAREDLEIFAKSARGTALFSEETQKRS